jgi:hypothetical protein
MSVADCVVNIQNFRYPSLDLPALNLLISFLQPPDAEPGAFVIVRGRGAESSNETFQT